MTKEKITIDPLKLAESLIRRAYQRPWKTKNCGYLLEGYCHPPTDFDRFAQAVVGCKPRRVKRDPYDVVVAKILEKMNRNRTIREWGNVSRLIDSINEGDCGGKTEIAVTGLRVPEDHHPRLVDPIKYSRQLIELSDKCEIFVVTDFETPHQVYSILSNRDERRLHVIRKPHNLEILIPQLISSVYSENRQNGQ